MNQSRRTVFVRPNLAGVTCAAVVAFAWIAGCERQPTATAPARPNSRTAAIPKLQDGAFHVYEGDDLQTALDAAAKSEHKVVRVHAGTYRPRSLGQALIRFNQQHDGITMVADGRVTLSAANPSLTDPDDPAHPSAVNHVVYFGDGIGPGTVLRGFRIADANGFIATDAATPAIEPNTSDPKLERGLFFFADGGAIKIFGRSAPTLEKLVIENNYSRLCAGGISIEQRGYRNVPAILKDIQFLNNTCDGTGPAVDVLSGSAAVLDNCLFVNNIGNTGMDRVEQEFGLRYNAEHGSGALTVFPESRVEARRCTFTDNWNGVDDHGSGSIYEKCLFWGNDRWDKSRPGRPYEIDILDGTQVKDCVFGGNQILDLRDQINEAANQLGGPAPGFDERYRPAGEAYRAIGFRPWETPASPLDLHAPTSRPDPPDPPDSPDDGRHSESPPAAGDAG